MDIYIYRRAGWGFSLICGLSQDKWPSKMGTYHWEGHQVFFNAYLQGSESSALLRGMCPSPGFGKKWDRHIPLRSYGDLRTNLWIYICVCVHTVNIYIYIYLPAAGRGVLRCCFERFGKTAGRMLYLMVFILHMSHLPGRTPYWDPCGSLVHWPTELPDWYSAISHTLLERIYIYIYITIGYYR